MVASVLLLVASLSIVACSPVSVEEAWGQWKVEYNRTYHPLQEPLHLQAFTANLQQINELNAAAAPGEAEFALNKFSDLTPEQFKSRYLTYRRSPGPRPPVAAPPPAAPAAASVDWREKGAVTPVKDQGQCGSCWAFSATEQIESQWILAGHPMTKFSPQQIVSCDKKDEGCNGGDTVTAYKYVMKAGGLASSSSYPYTSGGSGKSKKCQKFKVNGGTITGSTYATKPCETGGCKKQNEVTLQAHLASTAPVSICVNAGKWQHYKKGVMTHKQCGPSSASSLDHCVQLVGYQKAATKGYYMVRNSWNTDWGVEGYIHLAIGSNTCGIANEATFVTVK